MGMSLTQIDIDLYSLPLAPIVAVVATYSMVASDNSWVCISSYFRYLKNDTPHARRYVQIWQTHGKCSCHARLPCIEFGNLSCQLRRSLSVHIHCIKDGKYYSRRDVLDQHVSIAEIDGLKKLFKTYKNHVSKCYTIVSKCSKIVSKCSTIVSKLTRFWIGSVVLCLWVL